MQDCISTDLCGAVSVSVLNSVRACYSLCSVDVIRLNTCVVERVRCSELEPGLQDALAQGGWGAGVVIEVELKQEDACQT